MTTPDDSSEPIPDLDGFITQFGDALGRAWFGEGLSWAAALRRLLGLYVVQFGPHYACAFIMAGYTPDEAEAAYAATAEDRAAALHERIGEQAERHAKRVAALLKEQELFVNWERWAIHQRIAHVSHN